MKFQLLTLALLISYCSHAQNKITKTATNEISVIPAANTYKTYGYIDGKRLDSLDAAYAEFSWGQEDHV